MIRLNLSIAFNHPPRCPLCQQDLNSFAIVFDRGIAWCAECVSDFTLQARNDIYHWAASTRFRHIFTKSHGILWYTPHHMATRRIAAHLLDHAADWHRTHESTGFDPEVLA